MFYRSNEPSVQWSISPTCLRAAFTSVDPETDQWLDCHFALSGSTLVKASPKTSMKLTPGFNFTNVLGAAFMLVDHKRVKRYWLLNCLFTLLGSARVKAVQGTLMKLSPGFPRYIWKIQTVMYFGRGWSEKGPKNQLLYDEKKAKDDC